MRLIRVDRLTSPQKRKVWERFKAARGEAAAADLSQFLQRMADKFGPLQAIHIGIIEDEEVNNHSPDHNGLEPAPYRGRGVLKRSR